jgi:hypothetical protein
MERRFYDIAASHLATLKVRQENFIVGRVALIIAREFVERFIKGEGRELNERNINKMLSAAVKKAEAEHKVLTHYIPCVVVDTDKPQEFSIGLVKFTWMESFLRDHSALFEVERERICDEHIKRCQDAIAGGAPPDKIATSEGSARIADRLVNDTLAYFRKFKWMAIVDVPKCDVVISHQRAETAVEAALDILKLFFGQFHGEPLRQGHSRGVPPKLANLTREGDGRFNFSLQWSRSDTSAVENWYQGIIDQSEFYFTAAASALDSCLDPQRRTHLKQRFLDAMSWYGQAVSDPLPSVQIIKYVAALERLTMTKKLDRDLTQTVTRRIAILSYYADPSDFKKALADAETVYDCRSALMHGSKSPFDKDLQALAPLAEEIARKALFSSLEIFVALHHEVKGAKPSDLEKKYQNLEAWAKQTFGLL